MGRRALGRFMARGGERLTDPRIEAGKEVEGQQQTSSASPGRKTSPTGQVPALAMIVENCLVASAADMPGVLQ